MLVGVVREIKKQEFRVGLTPAAVSEYCRRGHSVIVESGAGGGIAVSDDVYRQAGAAIAQDAREVFERAAMIVKVKEPQPEEWQQLRPGQILFTYLHLAPDPDQAQGLLDSGCIAVAYETVTDANGSLPLLTPMSEVAGRLSIEAAAESLRRTNGGRGLLLGGVPGVAPARVVVLGGGVVGAEAARVAIGMGAEVTIIDRSLPRLRYLTDIFGSRIRTRMSTTASVEAEVTEADVVIGAVLIPGASAPRLVPRSLLGRMRPGAVLVDVAIDQGGCFETSHPTTHDEPTFTVEGIVHYCVANMPGAVPITSSEALNNATLSFGLALAADGEAAFHGHAGLRAGLNVYRGRIANCAVADSLGRDFSPLDELIAA